MKATIKNSWYIDRKIIILFHLANWKKCYNVIISKKVDKKVLADVLIDNNIYIVLNVKVIHPIEVSMSILKIL
jgi:hypothetical protein